jgi:hypothetical protein
MSISIGIGQVLLAVNDVEAAGGRMGRRTYMTLQLRRFRCSSGNIQMTFTKFAYFNILRHTECCEPALSGPSVALPP